MKNYKRIAIFILVIGLIFISFNIGYFARDIQIARVFFGPKETDFALITETYQILKDNFVEPDGIDYQKMIHGAAAGMVQSLQDPHTVFFNPADTKRFLEDAEGRFEGVGMEVGIKDNQLQVIAPLKGTPANKAGLLPGDAILKINKTETKDLSLEEAVNLIRGPKGTEVVLSVLRFRWDTPRDFSIIRDVIVVPSLEWQMLEGNVAHIKIYHFHRNAGLDFKKIALEIIESPAEAIILDVRGNSGGYLDVSLEIGGWFLEREKVFVIEESIKGQRKEKTRGVGRLTHYPIVVLVDKGSASASEILAGALRDNRGVQLIGETSFGKGSIQMLERLSDGSTIKITVAHWLTPSGHNISEKGLVPDIKVDLTLEDHENKRDPQLDKAIEIIKKMI